MKRDKANYLIQSVSHAVDVLEELGKPGGEVGVTDLSKRLKLHKNNVFRLLATLELRGYVEQNKENENYRLGVRALQLGQAYLTQSNLVSKAESILKGLAENIGETVSLAVLQNGQVQYPLSIESKRPVKVNARVAVSFPAKMNAAGRLLTAHLSDAVLAELLATNTPQDVAIKNALNELRNSGAIIDRGAIEAEVVALARVIKGINNEVVGAIEILVPQYRVKLEDAAHQLEDAASKVSTALGSQAKGLTSVVEKEIHGSTIAVTQATQQAARK